MKITNANVIQRSERELFDGILAELDWNAIEEIFKKRHHLEIQDDIEYKSGDIVVVEDQVAYRFDFEVKLNLSVFLNRRGDSLAISTGKTEVPLSEPVPGEEADIQEFAAIKQDEDIEQMISDINGA